MDHPRSVHLLYSVRFAWASQVTPVVKNLPASAGDMPVKTCLPVGLIPGLGRSPGGEHGNSLKYSCLENAMDRGDWWAIVHRVTQRWTWLKQLNTHTHTHTHRPAHNFHGHVSYCCCFWCYCLWGGLWGHCFWSLFLLLGTANRATPHTNSPATSCLQICGITLIWHEE